MTAFKKIFWSVIAVAVGILVASVLLRGGKIAYSFFKQKLTEEISAKANGFSLEKVPGSEIKNGPSYLVKTDGKKPIVSAEAYLIGDLDTGEVILSKNSGSRFPIASVSKLMTALVSLNTQNQDEITKISNRAIATYGKNGGFRTGEKMKLSELLYPLLLESSNDAAEAIAEHKNRSEFIRGMNQAAAVLGLEKTSYEEPTGLSPNNQSTVSDLFRLTSHIYKNKPEIFDITKERNKSYANHTWFNISQFLKEKGYIGGKSGFIDESKETNVALFTLPLANGDPKNLAIIILRSNDRHMDTKSLLKYVQANVYYGSRDAFPFAMPAEAANNLPDDETTLAFVGDIMLDRGVKFSVMKNFDGDYGALFKNAGLLKDADISFANIEGPISDNGADQGTIYSFRMSPNVVPALKDAGFDVASSANNHAGDWGRIAYEDTLENLSSAGILPTGGGSSYEDAKAPKIIEKNGIKIGFIGFSDVGPNWLAAGAPPAGGAGILLASDPNFDEIVRNAAVEVDDLVVSFHWGEEYKTDHTARQEELAHRAIDNGAKIIVGHHPHTIEDTETYKDGFIAYSLGNFIFDQAFSKDTMQGLVLTITLKGKNIANVDKKMVTLNQMFQPEKLTRMNNN